MSFRFVAWSDSSWSSFTKLVSEAALVNTLSPAPAFTCFPGDLVADGSGFGSSITGGWKTALNTGGNLWDKTFASRGNHDCTVNAGCTSADATTWQNIFNFGPETDIDSIAYKVGGVTNYNALDTDLTYSFDYQNAHFVFLDCAGGDDRTMTSSQITWLNNDLNSAQSRTNLQHAFLFWHGPIYDNGTGHCCSCSSYQNSSSCQPSGLVNTLNTHLLVSATFHGHEHMVNYAHITSAEIPGLTREFETFISGGAGAGLYNIETAKRCDYYLGSSPTSLYYGMMVIDVDGINYTVRSYRQDTGTEDWSRTFTNNYNPGGCVNPTCTFQLT